MSSPANLRPPYSLMDVFSFLQAFFWLTGMQLAIAFFRFQVIAGWLGLKIGSSANAPSLLQAPMLPKIAWAIAAAAHRTPWVSTCLAQALAGAILLKRRSIPGLVYLGLAKDPATQGGYAAHAWLTSGDSILTGAGNHEGYTVIAIFTI